MRKHIVFLLGTLSVMGVTLGDDAWKFLHSYPEHYVADRLKPGETLSLDGKLDDPGRRADSRQKCDMRETPRNKQQHPNLHSMAAGSLDCQPIRRYHQALC